MELGKPTGTSKQFQDREGWEKPGLQRRLVEEAKARAPKTVVGERAPGTIEDYGMIAADAAGAGEPRPTLAEFLVEERGRDFYRTDCAQEAEAGRWVAVEERQPGKPGVYKVRYAHSSIAYHHLWTGTHWAFEDDVEEKTSFGNEETEGECWFEERPAEAVEDDGWTCCAVAQPKESGLYQCRYKSGHEHQLWWDQEAKVWKSFRGSRYALRFGRNKPEEDSWRPV